MPFGTAALIENGSISFLVLVALVAASSSFAVFVGCYYWFRRDQRGLQRKIITSLAQPPRRKDDLFVTGRDAAISGELVARFKVKQGRQVVSILEADGKRFIHVNGNLSGPERARMVRYLKSEGFMS